MEEAKFRVGYVMYPTLWGIVFNCSQFFFSCVKMVNQYEIESFGYYNANILVLIYYIISSYTLFPIVMVMY